MRHGEEVVPSPWVEILKEWGDRHMWTGLSSPIVTGVCECEALCECSP